MRDTEFYEALLGLSDPWKVTKVELSSAAGRVDVWVEDRSGFKWKCPECKQKVSIYYHSEERACLLQAGWRGYGERSSTKTYTSRTTRR